MPPLSLDQLFVIAEAAPVLDGAEAALRAKGKKEAADGLFKLQQDAGLEIDNEMTGSFSEPAPGPSSAALRAAYEPVTNTRVAAVLSKTFEGLDKGPGQNGVLALLRTLATPATAPPAAPEMR